MKNYIAEFLGTTFFLFVILKTGDPLFIGAALAFVILLAGPISGGHFNPAVSIVMAYLGKIKTTEMVGYILAQVLGALTALVIYKGVSVLKLKL